MPCHFDDEEEHHAARDQQRPDPQRNGFIVEQPLERRRVGEQQLQRDDRADAERKLAVAQVRFRGQRGVEQVAAVEQVEYPGSSSTRKPHARR